MEDSNLFGAPSAPSFALPKFPEVTFPVPEINLFTPPFNAEQAEERRERYLTKQHTIAEKMQLYNCST